MPNQTFSRLTISEQMSYQRFRQVIAAWRGNGPPVYPQGRLCDIEDPDPPDPHSDNRGTGPEILAHKAHGTFR